MNTTAACAVLFGLGMYGVLTRRDLVGILVALEVMLGAANLQLVTLATSRSGASAPTVAGAEAVALLIMVLAAAEAALGLALLLTVWRRSRRSGTDQLAEVKG